MEIGDLVKITKHGLWSLQSASKLPGLVVELGTTSHGRVEIVYVVWPNRKKPKPYNVRWLERINEKR